MNEYTDCVLHKSLHRPVHAFAARPGKRIRCGLMQHAYSLAGGTGQFPEALGDAVEWLHAGSLVIDDIQDDSNARRDCPSMHRQIGVPLAINAGNWMYFRAFELLNDAALDEQVRSQSMTAMISAARICHEGQALDLSATVDKVPMEHWEETVERVSDLKTGTLVQLATTLGAVAADANSASVAALGRFGRHIGKALQMRNDLDELSQVEQRDDDLRSHRLTWVWAWARCEFGEQAVGNLRDRLLASVDLPDDCQRLDFSQIAEQLLGGVQARGNRVIQQIIRREIRLLSEHVVDKQRLHTLQKVLDPIDKLSATPEPSRPRREFVHVD